MNELQLAEELQRAKHDADEWGDAEVAPAIKHRLRAMISVRFGEHELVAVQSRAGARGETVSAYLRGLALRDVAPTPQSFPRFNLVVSQFAFSTVSQWPPAPTYV
jgi:hypothetical protein